MSLISGVFGSIPLGMGGMTMQQMQPMYEELRRQYLQQGQGFAEWQQEYRSGATQVLMGRAAPPCDYCGTKRDSARRRCDSCGAPYS